MLIVGFSSVHTFRHVAEEWKVWKLSMSELSCELGIASIGNVCDNVEIDLQKEPVNN